MNDNLQDISIKLKEEQLDLAKEWIKTGDVKIYKELLSEEKVFSIPIQLEVLIIEKTSVDNCNKKNHYNPEDLICIPLSEERVDFSKHMVKLEDVSVYKQQFEELVHIEETLKHEEAKVKISGSPVVIDNS
ncbi:YsnF/AvaK domain-containing protein [Clostridium sp. C8-1-8]|uniref:YsnF/AvaK domain-containing protein n=1 Tax=Clostridium sp. C8-1-8 TaxID=2698831 RepID=UPI00136A82B9|nr:YsnF/AvaK domain-containing protein [Clostridium sp. C8-1-8]